MEKVFSPLPKPSPPPPPRLTPKYAIVRKSDAKHNRHQKGVVPVVPGDQAPYMRPIDFEVPPALPTAKGDLPNIIDMNNETSYT